MDPKWTKQTVECLIDKNGYVRAIYYTDAGNKKRVIGPIGTDEAIVDRDNEYRAGKKNALKRLQELGYF